MPIPLRQFKLHPIAQPTFDNSRQIPDPQMPGMPPPMQGFPTGQSSPPPMPMPMPMPMRQMLPPPPPPPPQATVPDSPELMALHPGSVVPPPPMPRMPSAPPEQPPPPVRQSALDMLRHQRPRPVPNMQGWRGYVGSFLAGGVPALAMHAMDPKARQRQAEYDANAAYLANLAELEDKETGRRLQDKQVQSIDDYRTHLIEDRNTDNARQEAAFVAGLGQEVQPGTALDTKRYQYTDHGGKKYQRLSEFGESEAKQEALERGYRPIPDFVADAMTMPRGTKVPPHELDGYLRMVDAMAARASNEGLRRELSHEANQTRMDIANMSNQTRMDIARSKGVDDEERIERIAQALAGGNPTPIDKIASLRGDRRERLFDRVLQINPGFDMPTVRRKLKVMDDYEGGGKGSESLRSFDTFLQHAGESSDAVNKVRLQNIPAINKPINWWRRHMSGSPEFQSFITSLEPVRKEFESFMLGGRALYAEDRKAAEVILNDDSSPAQVQAALKQMAHTAKARMTSENHRFKRAVGRDIKDPISQEAIEGAAKLGVNINIGSANNHAPAPAPVAPAAVGPAAGKQLTREKIKEFMDRVGTPGMPKDKAVEAAKKLAAAEGYTF